jgi:ABC-type multidrug transport system fused ATPase/permease subunit
MSFILDGQAETHRHYQEIIDQRQLNLSANQGRRLAFLWSVLAQSPFLILF